MPLSVKNIHTFIVSVGARLCISGEITGAVLWKKRSPALSDPGFEKSGRKNKVKIKTMQKNILLESENIGIEFKM